LSKTAGNLLKALGIIFIFIGTIGILLGIAAGIFGWMMSVDSGPSAWNGLWFFLFFGGIGLAFIIGGIYIKKKAKGKLS